ncbi:hypothetical protein J0383_17510 [Flavobacterium endoglycinae]|uniref:Uncharacterized protein n=1 Tax=Flavobacterium endoglycinae TaxID=2816357 RepID=A0ABX7QC25_9FLAO|nr:hypothetical protein [Flavobacterium endoglycinae]QSW88058.1 hypothetical protein J0383_17510 [Flavobacterium endoglycinae]
MEVLQILYICCLVAATIKATVLGWRYSLQFQNYLAVYLIGTLGLEFYGSIKTLLKQFNFAVFFNIYAVFCILFFGVYFSRVYIRTFKRIGIFATSGLLLYLLFFVEILSKQFLPQLGILVALFYIFNSILWFFQKLKLPVEGKITDDPNFWISTALLFWSTYIIFRFTPMYLFEKEDQIFLNILRKIGSVVNFIMYALFYFSLLKYEAIAKERNK